MGEQERKEELAERLGLIRPRDSIGSLSRLSPQRPEPPQQERPCNSQYSDCGPGQWREHRKTLRCWAKVKLAKGDKLAPRPRPRRGEQLNCHRCLRCLAQRLGRSQRGIWAAAAAAR